MEIADEDGSGTIDPEEFNAFIAKIDYNQSTSSENIKSIFEGADTKGDGELSIEEFGVAIYESAKLLKPEEDNEDLE